MSSPTGHSAPLCRWLFGCAAILCLMTLGLAAQGKQQIPLIRSNTTIVDIPVLVLGKDGQPMQELSQSAFAVYDDGRLQHVSGFDHAMRPLSVAIIVDTYNWSAIDQAKRAARLISDMVVGAQGEAGIYVPGPQARCILPFTSDTNRIANVLQHLTLSPAAPEGGGSITAPLNLAMLTLHRQPRARERAALVISSSDAGGTGAEALLASGMSEAIPIFRIEPNQPANAPQHVNPDTPATRGEGQGSQREQHPASPMDSRGQPNSAPGMNLDLGGLLGAMAGLAGKVVAPHHLNYVFYTGGVSYSPGNDHSFDQRLSLIGEEMRSFYHIFYSPNDLTPQAALHAVTVQLELPKTANAGRVSYRRTYVGIRPH
ncbi:MAG: VWA domain-containing protein [Terriglobales bacterium]